MELLLSTSELGRFLKINQPIYYCNHCKKIFSKLDDLLFVEDGTSKGFCSEYCIESFYTPIIVHYEEREKELEKWLTAEGYESRYIIRPLHNKYGPSITMPELQLIVVSEETCPVAKEINEIRREHNLPLLHIAVLTMVMAEDQISISSTRIRAGQIDRDGRIIYHGVSSQ